MDATGVVDVHQPQVGQVRQADERAAGGHHQGMQHQVVMDLRQQDAGPERGQAGDQQAQRTDGAVPAALASAFGRALP